MQFILGIVFIVLGVAEIISGTSLGLAGVQLIIGACFLISVPFAYRQNTNDRKASRNPGQDL